MSVLSAMNIAGSSLQAAQAQANAIANDIANANTPGYVRTTLPQSEMLTGSSGSGVATGVLQRLGDAVAAAAANQANGGQSYSQAMVAGLTTYVQTLGEPSDSTSLPSVLSAFSGALTALSANPADPTTQGSAVSAANTLAGTLNGLDSAVDGAREQADQNVAAGVAQVNSTLDAFAKNELAIKQASAAGQSTASLENTRDQLLSTLSGDVPIQVRPDGQGGVTVTTDRGTTLWDGEAHKLSFTATANIPSNMAVTGDAATGMVGGLGSVSVDGHPIQMSQNGSIAGNLQLRDGTLPQFSQQLNQIAGNLITTFQNADPTVVPGQTGLFTDAGAALTAGDTASLAGLAGRIAVNANVDPAQGGQVWRMSTGVQATAQGSNTSDNSTVLGFVSALQQQQSYDTTSGLPGSMTLGTASTEVAGVQQAMLSNWTANNTDRTQQASAAQTTLSNATGVNVDEELQRLLVVQQTYAATTQVMQAAASMLDALNQIH